ncbi:sulfotransferase family protein [Psychroflexus montanilacus]|uniref:sulfotransferase family protein n=1 Tax=Psychroflexus montanilacus TaxID=2873598 RepID=UPI001CCE3601|nr:sulfotransferase [Psychroflexus montanilacus]MBZ9652273.1 sulfotransferase domain-containing protein [Psychroflexus montanilacus]
MRLTPNFFIVGTPKSGTTSLFYYLQEHPEVFLPKIKEPHFFSYPEVENTYYKVKIVKSKNEYFDLFESKKDYKAVGDLSTSYLFNSKSAERIYHFNPNSKIIMVLRNPVERALSHYLMDINLGYIKVPLQEVINNKEKYKQHYNEYIEPGFYDQQIISYKNYFNDDQILIILSDNLFKNTSKSLNKIFDFLEVSKNNSESKKEVHNQYSEPRYKVFNIIARSNNLKSLIPSHLKSKLKHIFYKKNAEKPNLKQEAILLKELYNNSIANTEVIINQDLSNWK